eukprot:Gb_12137 [translate_table: standard]
MSQILTVLAILLRLYWPLVWIRTSLQTMEKAIQGLVVMSSELEKAYRSMAINQSLARWEFLFIVSAFARCRSQGPNTLGVPELWKNVSYPSLMPLESYVKDLLERLRVIQDWYKNGPPAVHWISGFFFAQSFMTAALQNYARKYRLAIDVLAFDFHVLDEVPGAGPEDGVYIRGLFLEGCGWDPEEKCLCESRAKVMHVPAPVIWLKPAQVTEIRDYPHYNCPVYRTAERRGVLATTGHSTNFLMGIRMPSKHPPGLWTRRGVAMLCSLSG